MPTREKAHLMTASEIDRTLVHLAHEIVEKTERLPELVFVGVRRRGELLAQRLARKIGQLASLEVPVGGLDIQQYRDDLERPRGSAPPRPRQLTIPIEGRDVILVDDVLNTGRTTRAALDAIFDHGRPRRIRLCVLLDRGGRELPIEASFVGKRVSAEPPELIEVRLQEEDEMEKVLLLERVEEPAAG